MSRTNPLLGACLALALPALALAADKQVSKHEDVTAKVTIEAIDHEHRLITLKDKDGGTDTIYAGPEVKRFDELKVGQTVVFHYLQSTALQVRKHSAAAPAPVDKTKIERLEGAKPAASLDQTQTATVTVLAIDAKVPSLKVQTEGGSTASFRVEDPANLKGIEVGDKIDITYKAALLISVE
jgi:hypothetical protein